MKHSETLFTFGILGLLVLILVPLPPFLLDVVLSFNILLSFMTLLTTLYIKNALEFNAFPSFLLFLTFFRLALNIATTRMILSSGDCGDIIATFGKFVIMDSVFVGAVVFTILTIVNFLVITKGASRIAEVAARFNLEALTGKQIGIDTTQNLLAQEVKQEREKISKEAEFYGAMDGASKFVRGEAIASLVITIINIMGGVIMGLWRKEGGAFFHYTQLTIGDGLVTQIPSLLVSLGAGIMVSRASLEKAGPLMIFQIFQNRKIIALSGVFLTLLSLIPGMPKIIMIPMGLSLYLFSRKADLQKEGITITLGMRLGCDIRREVFAKIGYLLPQIDMVVDPALKTSYVIKKQDVTIKSGNAKNLHEELLAFFLKKAHTFLTMQDAANMLSQVRIVNGAVVEELLAKKFMLTHLHHILKALLKEEVPIHDLSSILEIVAGHFESGMKIESLLEEVRKGMAKRLLKHFFGNETKLYAITFEPEVEEMIATTSHKRVLLPHALENLENKISSYLEEAKHRNIHPLILTNTKSRFPVASLLEKYSLPVFSYAELGSEEVNIEHFGKISNEILIANHN